MKNKILRKGLIILTAMIGLTVFQEINEVKAEAGEWTYENNSWHYYSGPSIQTGWCKDNGYWYYLDEYGMMKTGWIKSEGNWYYFAPDTGRMLTGWIQYGKDWYYLDCSGKMVTGWLKYNGNLYYLNTYGVMVKDIYIDSYYLGPDGAWIEGK